MRFGRSVAARRYDMSGISYRHFHRRGLKMLANSLTLAQANYPEDLCRSYIVRVVSCAVDRYTRRSTDEALLTIPKPRFLPLLAPFPSTRFLALS